MRILFLSLVFGTVLFSCSTNNPAHEEWIALFNGKDLAGWQAKISGYPAGENFGNTFRADSGLLRVRYDAYDSFRSRFGHLFFKEKFSHYTLVVEYRFIGPQCTGGPGWAQRNSGVMLHGQDPATMGLNQDFPISIEAQFLGGLGDGPRSTANLCTPGTEVLMADTLFTPHCINSTSETYNGDQWVRVEFLVLGDSLIRHMINGKTVMEYTKPRIGGGVVNEYDSAVKLDGKPLTEGWLSLQSESHPIDFRKVELLNLKGCMDPKAKNFKSYFVASDPSACVY